MSHGDTLVQLLGQRTSCPQLIEPPPTDGQLYHMFQSASRAADHARLKPWRFLLISGACRELLGDVFAQAALAEQADLSEESLARYRGLPMRAPLLIALICKIRQHPKVPLIEQQLSLGAAAQNILNAAYALGVGAYWRTGAVCYHSKVSEALGLEEKEQLLGFIYTGTPLKGLKTAGTANIHEFVSTWDGCRLDTSDCSPPGWGMVYDDFAK